MGVWNWFNSIFLISVLAKLSLFSTDISETFKIGVLCFSSNAEYISNLDTFYFFLLSINLKTAIAHYLVIGIYSLKK